MNNNISYIYVLGTCWGTIKVRWFWNAFLESSIFSKKKTKTHHIVVKMNPFIGFLEEFTAWQFAVEINWPLVPQECSKGPQYGQSNSNKKVKWLPDKKYTKKYPFCTTWVQLKISITGKRWGVPKQSTKVSLSSYLVW